MASFRPGVLPERRTDGPAPAPGRSSSESSSWRRIARVGISSCCPRPRTRRAGWLAHLASATRDRRDILRLVDVWRRVLQEDSTVSKLSGRRRAAGSERVIGLTMSGRSAYLDMTRRGAGSVARTMSPLACQFQAAMVRLRVSRREADGGSARLRFELRLRAEVAPGLSVGRLTPPLPQTTRSALNYQCLDIGCRWIQ